MNEMQKLNFTEILIEEVRKRPFLWQTQIKRERVTIMMAWMEVAETLKIPESLLRAKWKNLRDVFRREHAKVLSNKSTKWQYYHPLMFLNNGYDGKAEDDETNESENYVYDSDPNDDTPQDPIDNESVHSSMKIKVEPTLPSEHYFEVVESDVVMPKKRKYNRKEDDSDTCDYDLLYLKSLVPYFKQLDPMRKLIVRSRIQDILMNEIARCSNDSRLEPSSSSKY